MKRHVTQRTDESKQLEARLGDIWPYLVDSNTGD
jgi:hypothetical protein